MLDLLGRIFSADGFLPHGHCYRWEPGLVWLHVTSDFLIGAAYVAISVTLALLVRRIRDIPFNWMFLAFGGFIIACGTTHFMEVWTLWTPTYWLAGDVKALTAVASVTVAFLLPPLVPRAATLARDAGLAEERRHALEVAHAELETLYEKVRELDAVKTQFFANVSHELRTPLTLVLGPAEKLLADDALPERHRHEVEIVRRNARTVLRHVNDLLDVAKLEAGKVVPSHAAVDLAQLVRLVASHFEGLAEERGIAFPIEAPVAIPAELDPEKIQRVLLNLLANAFKFVPVGGTVRVAARIDGTRAVVTVEDSGPGVPVELREAVFERFRQGDGTATRRLGGTGLGLSIAKEFVLLHGGTIAVDEAPLGGARFTVVVPLAAPPGTPVRHEPSRPTPAGDEVARHTLEQLETFVASAATPSAGERPLVLVVEDNLEMNRFVAGTLDDDYRIATAFDGEEGLERALELHPDLIVSDVMMPRRSGDDMLRALRGHRALDGVPVVMLTAKADDELRVRVLRDGAQDWVMKPFSAEELRARVGNLVTVKRARDALQRELASQVEDLEALAGEVTFRRRELETAIESLRVARDHAERASRAKSDFLNLVSHELRTPLTSIRTYLYLLERDDEGTLTAKQRTGVQSMARASTRLLGLIESLLDYARLESGRLVADLVPCDLGALLDDVAAEMRPQAQQKDLTLTIVPIPDVPAFVSDRRLVRLVLTNLIGNGIKYTERGGVEVSVQYRDGAHRFSVTDTGPGIAAEQQRLVFEPFEQLEPLRQKHTPGVGLGLALVQRIADALGGRVELRSAPGSGSTFTVVLPSARGQELRVGA